MHVSVSLLVSVPAKRFDDDLRLQRRVARSAVPGAKFGRAGITGTWAEASTTRVVFAADYRRKPNAASDFAVFPVK